MAWKGLQRQPGWWRDGEVGTLPTDYPLRVTIGSRLAIARPHDINSGSAPRDSAPSTQSDSSAQSPLCGTSVNPQSASRALFTASIELVLIDFQNRFSAP